MKKRLFSILLITAFLLGVFCLPAAATDDPFEVEDGRVDHTDVPDDDVIVDSEHISSSDLKTTDACIEFIKGREGFVSTPVWDVSQRSIGYGCSTVYAEKYGFSTEKITKEDAEALLLCVLAEHETKLDAFLEKYDLQMKQHQYDALMSFTFNVGISWMNPANRLSSLLINGDYSVNEFASAMGVWCHVGKEIDNNLLNRRIREIKMFLFGAYEPTTEYLFCVLFFDGNGGSAQTDIAFYLEGEPYEVLFSAEHETEEAFLGWYTEDGTRITTNTLVEDDLNVYAMWGSAEMAEEDIFLGDRNIPDFDSVPDVPTVDEEEPTPAPEPEPVVDLTEVFSDVPGDAWYYDELLDLYSAQVINGYTDGTFKPSKTVTTGEALKMILLAAGYTEPEPVASHWARGYMNMALDNGILIRGEITDLDVPISRETIAKVAARALGIMRVNSDEPFTDTTNQHVLALYDYGIIEGYSDNQFKPNKSLNRAEITAIVWRIEAYF